MIQIINQRDPHLSPKRMGWNNIAGQISKLTSKTNRTGKQCRER